LALSAVATNRRIRRKRHRAALADVLYGISVSYVWRMRLYEAGCGVELAVNARTLDDVPAWLLGMVRRHRLEYRAAWVPDSSTSGWEGYEGYLMFRVAAAEFPNVATFSANNPETIYPPGHPLREP
jgi:hypothetical protein